MTTGSDHGTVVSAWFERVADRDANELIRAFEAAFSSLWQRSHLTLGEVTLTAIVDRVLHTATEQYAFLAPIEIASSGLRCENLRTEAGPDRGQLAAALGFLLVEFLTVLGNLTAEILTPALHRELAKHHGRAKRHEIAEDDAP